MWFRGEVGSGPESFATMFFLDGFAGACCVVFAGLIRDWAWLDMNYFRNAVSGEGVLFCRDGLGC